MINDLINNIAIKLNSVFDSDYKIYTESVKQGLVEPAFSIVLLQAEQTPRIPNRYFRTYPFDIHYFPKTKTKNEMYEVGEKLLIEMEYLDNLCRGTKMRYEVIDDVLHFFVNYDLFVKKQVEEVESMAELTVNSKTEA